LANKLEVLTKEKSGEWKKIPSRCYAILCERTDSLKALDSVAGYLENVHFYPINDINTCDFLEFPA